LCLRNNLEEYKDGCGVCEVCLGPNSTHDIMCLECLEILNQVCIEKGLMSKDLDRSMLSKKFKVKYSSL